MCTDLNIAVYERFLASASDFPLSPFKERTVAIGSDPVLTGYIDNYPPEVEADRHALRITWRSKTEDIVDCTPDIEGGQFASYKLARSPACSRSTSLFRPSASRFLTRNRLCFPTAHGALGRISLTSPGCAFVPFMTTAANAPDPTTPPPAADRPGSVARLLVLVRKLIDYGKELATTLQRRGVSTDLVPTASAFGTSDIRLILARIARGLLRAHALEERLVRRAARPDRPPSAPCAPSERKPRAVRPPLPSADEEAQSLLARMPTEEEIAAEVRRRPVGVVIADICRDLGILASHPLWRELQLVIIVHGGNLVALVKNMDGRLYRTLVLARPAAAPSGYVGASPAPAGTGPP
jgi:hypothetical protein